MRIRFRTVKDLGIVPLHGVMLVTCHLPWLRRFLFWLAGLAGKAMYAVPGTYLRRGLRNYCAVVGRTDYRRVYMELVDKSIVAGNAFGELIRGKVDKLAAMSAMDPHCASTIARLQEQYGGAVVVLPHCPGALLSAIRFGVDCSAALLVRDSRREFRGRVNRHYFDRLGPAVIYVNRGEGGLLGATREILRTLKAGTFLLGTTDRPWKDRPDMIQVEAFGQPVWLPQWPAKFSAKTGLPILPGFMHMQPNGHITIACGEPYIADDTREATQRWMTFFETQIRESPSDWFFCFEKRWARLLAKAADQIDGGGGKTGEGD